MLNSDNPIIVILDDEKYICNIVSEALSSESYQVHAFNNPEHGLDFINKNRVDLVLSDLVMGKHNGVEVLDQTLSNHSDAIVILMTAHPTVETAISVLKKGAYDFMVKPFKLDLLKATIRRGLSHQQIKRENVHLKEQVEFLKVTNTGDVDYDGEEFMQLVVNSCKQEMSASAVAMMEVNPNSNDLIGWVYDADNESDIDEILNRTHLEECIKSNSNQPIIYKMPVENDGNRLIKTLIIQPVRARKKLYGIINILKYNQFGEVTPGQLNVINLLGNSAASTIANQHLYHNLQDSYIQAITGLANAIEARDAYTAGHTDRVSLLAEYTAKQMGWDGRKITDLRMGCSLHDIGKIGVPDSILNKPDTLLEKERNLMNSHPQVGLKIIEGIELFKPAIPYILAHHERFDGKGYPNGLKGEDIPIEGRLLSVCDTFDAILSDRPYRKGKSLEFAIDELTRNSGLQFDPKIVNSFIIMIQSGQVDFLQMYGRNEDFSNISIKTKHEKVSV
jgi:response regulator RpfG family c-di-GMP phosphodiesterase